MFVVSTGPEGDAGIESSETEAEFFSALNKERVRLLCALLNERMYQYEDFFAIARQRKIELVVSC